MKMTIDPKKVDEVLTRGVVEVIHKNSLKERLLSGKKLRVKLGIDPTSRHIHLGRSVPLLKLRDFQELGHRIVFIVGDFTGIIGDTSDKESERPMLTKKEVETNMRTYKAQAGKLLDMDTVEWRHNSEWLGKLTYREIGEHADLFSVSDFIARENIKRRIDAGKRVSLREVLYPLMQGYDSVAVKADVELGGTDQRFNLLAGRTLQPHFKQQAQDILMTDLVTGTDGRKMSSSWRNTVNISDVPFEMYGKVMSMQDSQIVPYLTACTRVPMKEVKELERELVSGGNPRDTKMKLAFEITRMYHGEKKAAAAEQAFVSTFQKKEIPEDVPEIRPDYALNMISKGVIASKAELRRLFAQGAVSNAETEEKYADFPAGITRENPVTLKIGKRRFVKLLP